MLTGFLARVAQLLHACRWCGGAVAGNVEVADAVQEFSAFRKQAGGGMHATGVLLAAGATDVMRSEEHTSELQSLMRISYAVFCLKKKKNHNTNTQTPTKTTTTIRSK